MKVKTIPTVLLLIMLSLHFSSMRAQALKPVRELMSDIPTDPFLERIRQVENTLITVDRSDDASGLACTDAANDCSLRSAIENANSRPGGDAIIFQGNPTITVHGTLYLTDDQTVIGAFQGQVVTIYGPETDWNNDSIFYIAGDDVALQNLIIYGTENLIRISDAWRTIIADNLIGDDDPLPGGCNVIYKESGIDINIDDSIEEVGAWIYGNTIECMHTGVMIWDAYRIIIGENENGQANSAQKNTIRDHQTEGIFVNHNANIIIRNSTIENLGGSGIHVVGNTEVYGNQIKYNVGSGIYAAGFNNQVHDNTIQNNSEHGILIRWGDQNKVWNNTIQSNSLNGVKLEIAADENEIYSNTISQNGNSGVYIDDSDSNKVYGNTIQYQTNTGVELRNGARFNRIGCPIGGLHNPSTRNVINMNSREGIYIGDAGTELNYVFCNLIGVSADGLYAAGNSLNGIAIAGGASGNIIGNSTVERNIISGNGRDGIQIVGAGTNNNVVLGNYIGLDLYGNKAIANGLSGVAIFNQASNNRIGDKALYSAGNFIAGNLRHGVFIGDVGTTGNILNGNEIGDYDFPNFRHGVIIRNSDGNTIGSYDASTYQDIQYNNWSGVFFENADDNLVGPKNYVGNNDDSGIVVFGTSEGNDVRPKWIMNNVLLPIDLGDDGYTANDPGDLDSGPNTLLNFPVVTEITNHYRTISGTACTYCLILVYQASMDPTNNGGGGSYQCATFADGAGQWSLDLATCASGLYATNVTLVAIDGSGNTSEMSPREPAKIYLPLVVR